MNIPDFIPNIVPADIQFLQETAELYILERHTRSIQAHVGKLRDPAERKRIVAEQDIYNKTQRLGDLRKSLEQYVESFTGSADGETPAPRMFYHVLLDDAGIPHTVVSPQSPEDFLVTMFDFYLAREYPMPVLIRSIEMGKFDVSKLPSFMLELPEITA